MEVGATTRARIALLNEEMDAIHQANGVYWKQGESQSLSAKGEYKFRNERLDKIRDELAQLQRELESSEA